MAQKRVWKGPLGVKLLLAIIITKYNRCHYSFLRPPRQQVTGGSGPGPGARRLASCVLARISFPPKLRQGWCGSLTRSKEICGYWS